MVLLGLKTVGTLGIALRTQLAKRLWKAPEKMRQEGAGCKENYRSGEKAGQREQKSSQLGEEW